MSESKAEYYAKHLEQQNPNEQMELFQPVSLPTLLARMVTEFQVGLGDQSTEVHEILVRTFTADLLSAAMPILARYVIDATTPTVANKNWNGETVQRAWDGVPAGNVSGAPQREWREDQQRAAEALETIRAGKGVSAARKHLGLE